MSPTVIAVFMLGVTAFLGLFDLYLDRDKRKGNTYSELFRKMGRFWPPFRVALPLLFGLCLGHWFWTPQDVHDAGGVKLCPCPVAPVAVGPIDASLITDAGPTDGGDHVAP